MKVLFVAAEAAPFVKVGGLGDVMGALPKELKRQGLDVRVVIPYYKKIGKGKEHIKFVDCFNVHIAGKQMYCGIFETIQDGVTFYLLDNEYYFWREQIYGEYDDGERYAFFSKAAIEMMRRIDFRPDIIQANDWHTALSVVYLNTIYKSSDLFYTGIRTVFSIHNIEFQGKFSPDILGSVFSLGEDVREILMYDGCLNLLKGAIQTADKVTTVSKTYGQEILNPYFSFGMHNILLAERHKIVGIINGIDMEVFNPHTDKSVYQNYTFRSLMRKRRNKTEFQKEYALEQNEDIPMIAMVSRLTAQKGLDLVMAVSEEIAQMNMQFVLLGTGEEQYEYGMANFEWNHHDKVRSIIKFSTDIASKIYAASDFFLMPSRQEPCGLSQMIAMRYGSVPIVHRIGGLKDTVMPYNPQTGEGTGITFESYNAHDMLHAIKRALMLYDRQEEMKRLIKNAMVQDLSWKKPVGDYKELYEALLK